jgi:hypothetical protein
MSVDIVLVKSGSDFKENLLESPSAAQSRVALPLFHFQRFPFSVLIWSSIFLLCYIFDVVISTMLAPANTASTVLFECVYYVFSIYCFARAMLVQLENELKDLSTRYFENIVLSSSVCTFSLLNIFLFWDRGWVHSLTLFILYNLAVSFVEASVFTCLFVADSRIRTFMKKFAVIKVVYPEEIESNIRSSTASTLRQFFEYKPFLCKMKSYLCGVSYLALGSIVIIFSVSLLLFSVNALNGYIFLLTTLILSPILLLPVVTTCAYNKVLLDLEYRNMLETECLVSCFGVVLKEEILFGSFFSVGFSIVRFLYM